MPDVSGAGDFCRHDRGPKKILILVLSLPFFSATSTARAHNKVEYDRLGIYDLVSLSVKGSPANPFFTSYSLKSK